MGNTSSHLTLAVDELESVYRTNSAKLEFKPEFIYLPKPGRYVALYK